MIGANILEKLLDGAEVQWVPLESCATIERGRRVTKSELAPEKKYPVYSGGVTPMGFYDKFNQKKNTITVVKYGTAGFVNFIEEDFWANDVCYCVQPEEGVNKRYLFYYLKKQEKEIRSLATDAIPAHLPTEEILNYRVPIPCPENSRKSLDIQAKIVRVLDAFTELAAELAAELDSRKRQFNHIRGQLLRFESDKVELRALREIVETVTPPSKLNSQAYCTEGRWPIVDQGVEFIAGYTSEDVTPVPAGKYIIFGDHSEHIKYVDFPFVQGADGIKILRPFSQNAKYIYYALGHFYKREHGYKRHWSNAQETLIPIPWPDSPEVSLTEQARIVAALDIFDTLINSTTEGLPGEIALRQKQYEYYRDLLFSFPKPEEVEA